MKRISVLTIAVLLGLVAFSPVAGAMGSLSGQAMPSSQLGFGMSSQQNYYDPYGSRQIGYSSNTTPYGSNINAYDTFRTMFGSGYFNASMSFPGYLVNTYGPNGSGSSSITSFNPGFGALSMPSMPRQVAAPVRNNNTSMGNCFDSRDADDFMDEWDDNLDDLEEDLRDDIHDNRINTIDELRDEQDDFEDDFDDELMRAMDDACNQNVEDDLEDYEDDFLDDTDRTFSTLRVLL